MIKSFCNPIADHTGVQRMSTHRIMRHSLHLFPYRILIRQPLNCAEIIAREMISNATLQQLDVPKSMWKIWFSNESYFLLMASQTIRNGAFGNRKISTLPYHYPYIPKLMSGVVISWNFLLGHFIVAKSFIQSCIRTFWPFCVNLWRYIMHWRTVRTPSVSC